MSPPTRTGSLPRQTASGSSRTRQRSRLRGPAVRAAIGTRGEVEVFGDWVGFTVAKEPLYDPTGARIRA